MGSETSQIEYLNSSCKGPAYVTQFFAPNTLIGASTSLGLFILDEGNPVVYNQLTKSSFTQDGCEQIIRTASILIPIKSFDISGVNYVAPLKAVYQ